MLIHIYVQIFVERFTGLDSQNNGFVVFLKFLLSQLERTIDWSQNMFKKCISANRNKK